MEALQWQVLVPALCQPVWRRFVAAAQAAGKLPPGEPAPGTSAYAPGHAHILVQQSDS
jgi:hypothetical protein